MTDKLENRIRQGKAARLLLEDPGINEVMSELGQRCIKDASQAAWDNHDSEAATHLRTLRLLTEIRQKLEATIANGREAERELERLNDAIRRKR